MPSQHRSLFHCRAWMVVLSACASLSLHAAPVAPERIPALLAARHLEDTPGNAIVVGILDANGRHFYSMGEDDARQPANEHTVFEIGSLTKLFTQLLLADMTVAGQVKLEDPAMACLPPAVKVPSLDGHPITLLDLAVHRSGLARDFVDGHKIEPGLADLPSLYRFVTNFTPTREESPINEWALGLMLEGRTGQAIEVLAFNCAQYPLSANTYDSLAMAYEAHGSPADAIAAYRRALEVDPAFPGAAERIEFPGGKIEPEPAMNRQRGQQ